MSGFEEWFAEKWPKFDANGSMADALRESWQAGAEQMREDFAAKIEQNWGKEQADLCRKFPLPVGESIRAPEGSQ